MQAAACGQDADEFKESLADVDFRIRDVMKEDPGLLLQVCDLAKGCA